MKNNAFYVCPKTNGKGFFWNPQKNRIDVKYVGKFSKKALASFKNIKKKAIAIFAGADTLILTGDFSRENIPEPDFEKKGFHFINNYNFVKKNENIFWNIYEDKPWEGIISQGIINSEKARLGNILRYSFSSKLGLSQKFIIVETEKFCNRIFAGFVLDGLFIQENNFTIIESEGSDVLAFQKLIWDFNSIPV